MSVKVRDFAAGRKAFFIVPDTSVFSEDNLSYYFLLGFECYFIQNEKSFPIQKKIEIIASTFSDCVLFINIDAVIEGINWVEYINKLNQTYGSCITICVTFLKKQDKNFKNVVEMTFKNKIGIKGDCIQLEYQKRINVGIIQNYLASIRLQGRRQNIRAFCTRAYTYAFKQNDYNYTGVIQDISLSHFSIALPLNALDIRVGTVIPDFNFYLNGLIMRNPVTLIMVRVLNDCVLYVFAFANLNGVPGLSDRFKDQLVTNLLKLNNNYLKVTLEKILLQITNDMHDPEVLGNLEIGS